jgi:hypothetical protein
MCSGGLLQHLVYGCIFMIAKNSILSFYEMTMVWEIVCHTISASDLFCSHIHKKIWMLQTWNNGLRMIIRRGEKGH